MPLLSTLKAAFGFVRMVGGRKDQPPERLTGVKENTGVSSRSIQGRKRY